MPWPAGLAPRLPKRSRSRLQGPTREEISSFNETETLFKSNLFRLQTVELLLQAKCDPHIENADGKTSMDLAFERQHAQSREEDAGGR